jgi:hypothetical protein
MKCATQQQPNRIAAAGYIILLIPNSKLYKIIKGIFADTLFSLGGWT